MQIPAQLTEPSALRFYLVLPKDSTEPADWPPAASGNNRLHLSRQVLLDDADIAQAGADLSPGGRRNIEIRFTDSGAKNSKPSPPSISATNWRLSFAADSFHKTGRAD